MSRQRLLWFARHPAYSMDSYTPSTVPGCRTPHLWCEDRASLYDAMGPEFTLLRFDPAIDVAPLEAAARNPGVPLKVVDIEPPSTAVFYGGGLGVVAAGPACGPARRSIAGRSACVDRSCPRRRRAG